MCQSQKTLLVEPASDGGFSLASLSLLAGGRLTAGVLEFEPGDVVEHLGAFFRCWRGQKPSFQWNPRRPGTILEWVKMGTVTNQM